MQKKTEKPQLSYDFPMISSAKINEKRSVDNAPRLPPSSLGNSIVAFPPNPTAETECSIVG